MKYKKHIATSALAISLLVGGSSVSAATPQDLGIKTTHQIYQKHNRSSSLKVRNKKSNSAVGIVDSINGTGFTVNVKNLKTKTLSSIDVIVNASTLYKKDGIIVPASELAPGQKVVVIGASDKTTGILTAKIVKIATLKVPKK